MTTLVTITGVRRIKALDDASSVPNRFLGIVSALVAARIYQADVDACFPHLPDAATVAEAHSAWALAERRAAELACKASDCMFDRSLISGARIAQMVLTTRNPDELFLLSERINTAQRLLRRNSLGSACAASQSAFLLGQAFSVLGQICDEALGATEVPEPDDSVLALTA